MSNTCYSIKSPMLIIIMLSVVVLSVVMLSVAASPKLTLTTYKTSRLINVDLTTSPSRRRLQTRRNKSDFEFGPPHLTSLRFT